MTESAARVLHAGFLLAASVVGAPASAQDPAVADSQAVVDTRTVFDPRAVVDTLVLWPAWSESVAALGLGGRVSPLAPWAEAPHSRSRELCFAAGAGGAAAGLLAWALRSAPVDWPPGFDWFPARSWRSLPQIGAAFGKAVVCPPPWTRSPTDPVAPARPGA